MLGAMGAILFYRQQPLFMKILGNRWVGGHCLLAIGFSMPWAGLLPAPLRPQVLALLSLGAIMGQVANHPIINLENRVMDFDRQGILRHLCHPSTDDISALGALWRNLGQIPAGWSTVLIYIILNAVAVFVAWLSYQFFESPFLRLKNRFAIVQSSSSMKD